MRDEVFRRLSELANDVVSELRKLSDEDRALVLMSFLEVVFKLLNLSPPEITSTLELLKFKHLYETLSEAYVQVKTEEKEAI